MKSSTVTTLRPGFGRRTVRTRVFDFFFVGFFRFFAINLSFAKGHARLWPRRSLKWRHVLQELLRDQQVCDGEPQTLVFNCQLYDLGSGGVEVVHLGHFSLLNFSTISMLFCSRSFSTLGVRSGFFGRSATVGGISWRYSSRRSTLSFRMVQG